MINKYIFKITFFLILINLNLYAEDDFQVTKPGVITFTTEMTIEGKIEKPQVILVFSKETTKSGAGKDESSLIDEIFEPVKISTFEISIKKK